jgi:hypothetical protein
MVERKKGMHVTTEAANEPAVSTEATGTKKATWSTAIMFGLAVGATIYAYENWDTVSTQYLGLAYSCQNVIPELTKLPPANAMSPKLVGVVNHGTVSTTPERIECSGVGMFSDGQRVPIAYRVWKEGGQWWVAFEAS